MQIVVDNSSPVEEAREWLVSHKAEADLSWPDISKLTDVAGPTLSLFASGKYAGDNAKVAGKVLAYRDRLAAQAEMAGDLPIKPDWYDTETSQQLLMLLRWAQAGRIVLIVTNPGIGKTKVAERFAAGDPNVWLATMSPATAGVATMAAEVAEAMGMGQITGSPHQLSRKIRENLNGRKGLLLIDEAQELTDKAINEIRGWHDRTGVGIVLFGNDKVVGQLDSRKSALAQISSRFSFKHVQEQAKPADIDACLDAWNITDAGQRDFLRRLGMMPGALREITHTIEVAVMSALGEGAALSLTHLRAAARQRNVKLGSL